MNTTAQESTFFTEAKERSLVVFGEWCCSALECKISWFSSCDVLQRCVDTEQRADSAREPMERNLKGIVGLFFRTFVQDEELPRSAKDLWLVNVLTITKLHIYPLPGKFPLLYFCFGVLFFSIFTEQRPLQRALQLEKRYLKQLKRLFYEEPFCCLDTKAEDQKERLRLWHCLMLQFEKEGMEKLLLSAWPLL